MTPDTQFALYTAAWLPLMCWVFWRVGTSLVPGEE